MPDNNKKEVLEAEYVGETEHDPARTGAYGYSQRPSSGQGWQGGRGPHISFHYIRTNRTDACQGMQIANCITLVIFLSCLFNWGFLAALGFAFFYAIAAGIGLTWNVQRLLSGRMPMPWAWRIGSWLVCLLLVSWLV